MKSLDKIQNINKLVDRLNNELLKNKDWKIKFDNQRGANNYCLLIEDNVFSFNTYDSMISGLNLIATIFDRARNERGK